MSKVDYSVEKFYDDLNGRPYDDGLTPKETLAYYEEIQRTFPRRIARIIDMAKEELKK